MAGTTNNGVVGYISNPVASFPANSITVDIFGNTFYRDYSFGAGDDTGVYWNTSRQYTESQMLFLASMIKRYLQGKYDFGHKLRSSQSYDFKISLPTTANNEIDFDFMESFIRELEEERIRELEEERIRELSAYLTVSGLSDATLTEREKLALHNFDTLEWKEFRMGDLFDRVSTAKLPYKAADLPKEATVENPLPCLTSSFMNQGLNYYAPKENATVLKHVISIPSNSDVYRAYYQSHDFTVLSDAYAIRWNLNDREISAQEYLFMVACINQVTDLPIYSYKNKLGGWNVVQDKYIMLPVCNGAPDYSAMQDFISAVQKLVIKDVVQYADKKIGATKAVVNG